MSQRTGERVWGRFVAAVAGIALLGGLPAVAGAESVAEELIAILEVNGQLAAAQAAALREKAAVEREDLKREVMDEVRVQAEEAVVARDTFEDMASGEKTVVNASLAESMSIGGYIQVLGSLSDNSGPLRAGTGNRSSGVSTFETTDYRETEGVSVRRARVKIKGNVGPRTKYVVGFDGDNIDDPGVTDAVNFNDLYMEYKPILFDDTAGAGTTIRAGQFYVPFSREANLSSSKRLPISRSHFINELAPFREPGVMIYNKNLADTRLGLYAGMFNGIGENEDSNDAFLWVARAQFQALDGHETGMGGADWSIGAAVLGSRDGNTAGGNGSYDIADPVFVAGQEGEIQYLGRRIVLTADTQLDVGRFGFNGEFLYADYDVRDSVKNAFAPTAGAGTALVQAAVAAGVADDDVILVRDDEFWGFHVMPTFWILPEQLQAYVKYEYVEYGDVLDASMWGTTVGLNYHMLPKYRSLVRANWVHLAHESDVLGPNAGLADDDLEQDFFLLEWQTKF